jgi:hypothetical protein
VAEAFERDGIEYAIGGALAYGFWGVPRATVDIDVNVFVEDEQIERVVHTLTKLGAAATAEQARVEADTQGMFQARWGIYRVDLFTPSVPFSWEAMTTRVRIEALGHSAWILSAEATAVFKLLFFRPKDVIDLQRLVATMGAKLDAAYVRDRIVAMMGEDDERTRRWDEIVATYTPG